MLTKNRSSRWVLGRYLLAIPVLVTLISVVAMRNQPTDAEITLVELDTRKLTGFVYDETTKNPLAGANVVVIGTTQGTTTDAKGGFTLNFEQGKELAISFVGFKTIVCTPKMYGKVKANEPLFLFLPKETNVLGEVTVLKDELPLNEPNPTNKPKAVFTPRDTSEKVFMVVEQQPEFKGGVSEMYNFLGRNIKYPAAASRANVEGKVFVQFVVNKKGETQDIKILKGIGFGCDEEAVRVVQMMPAWIPAQQSGQPVAVLYNLPISFAIMKQKDKSGAELKKDALEDADMKNMIFIVDGIELTAESYKKLDPTNIESMDVLKGDKAIKVYGERGKDGVVVIRTKLVKPKKE